MNWLRGWVVILWVVILMKFVITQESGEDDSVTEFPADLPADTFTNTSFNQSLIRLAIRTSERKEKRKEFENSSKSVIRTEYISIGNYSMRMTHFEDFQFPFTRFSVRVS